MELNRITENSWSQDVLRQASEWRMVLALYRYGKGTATWALQSPEETDLRKAGECATCPLGNKHKNPT